MPLVPCFALLRHGRSENDERGIFHGNGTDETACGAAAGFAADAFLLPSALADSGVVSGTTVSGTVRVYLSSISSLTAVDVSNAGSYSVGGDTSRAL